MVACGAFIARTGCLDFALDRFEDDRRVTAAPRRGCAGAAGGRAAGHRRRGRRTARCHRPERPDRRRASCRRGQRPRCARHSRKAYAAQRHAALTAGEPVEHGLGIGAHRPTRQRPPWARRAIGVTRGAEGAGMSASAALDLRARAAAGFTVDCACGRTAADGAGAGSALAGWASVRQALARAPSRELRQRGSGKELHRRFPGGRAWPRAAGQVKNRAEARILNRKMRIAPRLRG